MTYLIAHDPRGYLRQLHTPLAENVRQDCYIVDENTGKRVVLPLMTEKQAGDWIVQNARDGKVTSHG